MERQKWLILVLRRFGDENVLVKTQQTYAVNKEEAKEVGWCFCRTWVRRKKFGKTVTIQDLKIAVCPPKHPKLKTI